MKSYLLLFVLVLSGCQTPGPVEPPVDTKAIQIACASATSSIQVATLYKEKLTPAQLTAVRQAVAVTQPVCGDRNTVPTLSTVTRAALDAAVTKLFQIATEVQK